MRAWLVVALAGCGSSPAAPSGTYAVTQQAMTSACNLFPTKTITFDADNVTVGKTYTPEPRLFAATNVDIEGNHVSFDLMYSLRYTDSGTYEMGDEHFALSVDVERLDGTASGTYHGSYQGQSPYDCTASFIVTGTAQ